MRRLLRGLSLVFIFFSPLASAGDPGNVLRVPSHYGVAETVGRLEHLLKMRGVTIFADIHFAAGARGVGMRLRPTQLLIFGNPRLGTQLLRIRQTVGLSLPMKILVWRDTHGQVWLGYRDPAIIARENAITGHEQLLAKMRKLLGQSAAEAAG